MYTQDRYSFEVDIFAVGLMIYELLLKSPPFEKNLMSSRNVRNAKEKALDLNEAFTVKFPPKCSLSIEAESLLRKLLEPNP